MKTNYLLFVLLLSVLTIPSKGAYKYSVQSGNWSQSSTWSGSTIPVCGDSILISPTHTVIVNSQVTYNCSSKTIVVIKGTLKFDGGNKLTMPCDSRVYIMGGGKITSDGGGNSNRIEICSQVLWTGSEGQISGPSCLPSTLPNCAQVMPVELISFEATQCGDKICVSWSTLTEHNNDFFVLQKMVGDVFVDVQKIGSKSVNGESRRLLSYDMQDMQPSAGVNYYRLMQVDLDGSFSTSKIVVINFTGSDTKAEVFPNPSSGNFTLKVEENVSYQVSILDCSGTVVRSQIVSGTKQAEVSGLSAGLYNCVIKSATSIQTIKIIVE